MTTEELITQQADAEVLANARRLVRGGKVIAVRKTENPDGSLAVRGKAEGAFGYYYTARFTLDPETGMPFDFSCSCKGVQPCVHTAALILNCSGDAGTAEAPAQKPEPVRPKKKPARPTSAALSAVMARCSAVDENLKNEMFPGTLRLIPRLKTQEGTASMDLLLEEKRQHRVEDPALLVRAVLNGESASYGSTLSFVHAPEMFDGHSRDLLQLTEDMLRLRYPHIEEYNPKLDRADSQVELSPSGLTRLLKLCSGENLKVNGIECTVSTDSPMIEAVLTASGEEGGFLKVPPVQLLEGTDGSWLVFENGIYPCTADFRRGALTFLYAMGAVNPQGDIIPQYLSSEDYQRFCGAVLPGLKPYLTVKTENVDLTEADPGEPSFRFSLSVRDETVLQLKPEAVYKQNAYPLFVYGKEYRNHRLEYPVGNLCGEWFAFTEDRVILEQSDEERIYDFLQEGVEQLREVGEVLVEDGKKMPKLAEQPKASVGAGLKGKLIDLDVQVEGIDEEELEEALQAGLQGKRFIKLKNGQYLSLEDGTLKVLTQLAQNAGGAEAITGDEQLPAFRAAGVEEILKNAGADIEAEFEPDFTALIEQVRTAADTQLDVPDNLQATLREYQLSGYRWLCSMAECGLGGLLADDMGLGKTIQVIAMLAHMNQTALIVTPASLVYNWESEINRFVPDLRTRLITGSAAQRQEGIEDTEAQIFITSYDYIYRDEELYAGKHYGVMVLDEAQNIRNPSAKKTHAVKNVQADCRFALSGTPVYNHPGDLWSIFDFILPGYLYNLQTFRSRYALPIVNGDEEAAARLSRQTAPFILRRRKEEVLTELPEKTIKLQYIPLTGLQRQLYQAQEARLRTSLAEMSGEEYARNSISFLSELTRLRQLCCAPELFIQDYEGESGKAEACIEQLKAAAEGGHRTLVFSQFTEMLELLQTRLAEDEEGSRLRCLYLSGSSTKLQRKHMVEEFQNGSCDVFFISLLAGGTGLTLTAADHVIIYDPWWNSAAEDQAVDRSHRFGQKNSVLVEKLVAKDTIEERIVALQQAKRDMGDALLSGAGSSGTPDREAILRLLSGEEAVFSETGETV